MSRIAELQRQLAEQQAQQQAAREDSSSGAPQPSGRKVNAVANSLAASFNPMMMMPGQKAPLRKSQGGESESAAVDTKQDDKPAEITHVSKARTSGGRRPATRPSFTNPHSTTTSQNGSTAAAEEPVQDDTASANNQEVSTSINFDDLSNPLDEIGTPEPVKQPAASSATTALSDHHEAMDEQTHQSVTHSGSGTTVATSLSPASPGVGGTVASIGESLSEAKHPIVAQANTSTLTSGHAASSTAPVQKPAAKADSPVSSRKKSISLSDSLQLSEDESDLDLGSDVGSPPQTKRASIAPSKAEAQSKAPVAISKPAAVASAAASQVKEPLARERHVEKASRPEPAAAAVSAASATPAATSTLTSQARSTSVDHELDHLLSGDNTDAFADFEMSQVGAAAGGAAGKDEEDGDHLDQHDPVSVSVSGVQESLQLDLGDHEHHEYHDNHHDNSADAAAAAALDELLGDDATGDDDFVHVGTDAVAAAMADDNVSSRGIQPSLDPLLAPSVHTGVAADAEAQQDGEEEVEEVEEVVEEETVEEEEVMEEDAGDDSSAAPASGDALAPQKSWHAQARAQAKALLAPPPPGQTKNAALGVKVVKARAAKVDEMKAQKLAEAKALAPQVSGPSKVHEPTAAVLAAKKEHAARVTPASKAADKKAKDAAYAARFSSGQFSPTRPQAFRAELVAPTQAAKTKQKRKGESWSLDESAAANLRNLEFGAPPPKEERLSVKKLNVVAPIDSENLPRFASPKMPVASPASAFPVKVSRLSSKLTPVLPVSASQLAETSARLSSPRSQKKKATEVREEEERKRSVSAKKKKVDPTESELALVASLTRPTTAASGRATKKVATGTGPTGFGGGEVSSIRASTGSGIRPPASARGPARGSSLAASGEAKAASAAAARPKSARASLGVTAGVVGRESKIPAASPAAARKSMTSSATSTRTSLTTRPTRPFTAQPTSAAAKPGELKSKTPTTSRKKKEEPTAEATSTKAVTPKPRSTSAKKVTPTTPTVPAPAASPSKLKAPSAITRPASARVSTTSAAAKLLPKSPAATMAAVKPVSAAKSPAAAKPVKTTIAPKATAPAATVAADAPTDPASAAKPKRLSVSAAVTSPAPAAASPPVGAVMKSKKQIAHEAAQAAAAASGVAPAGLDVTQPTADAPDSSASSSDAALALSPEEEQERRVREIRKAKLAAKVKLGPIAGEKVDGKVVQETTPAAAMVATEAASTAAASSSSSSSSSSTESAPLSAEGALEGFHTAYAPKSRASDATHAILTSAPAAAAASTSPAPKPQRPSIISPSSLSTGKPSHARSTSDNSVRRQQFAHDRLVMELQEVFDWLGKVVEGSNIVLTDPPEPDALFAAIESGAVLCGLVKKCQQIATEKGDAKLAGKAVTFKLDAKPKSFVARDNLSNFLSVMVGWGMPKAQLFEVDDLVLRKNDRQVIQSLLDVSRMCFAKFGIAPPQLVQFEMEIEAEEKEPEHVESPVEEPMPELPPTPPSDEPVDPAKPPPPKYLPYRADPSDPLDVAVGQFINGKAIDIYIKKVKAGNYFIGDVKDPKVHRVRLVRNLILVRVGGGWESFKETAQRKFDAQASDEAKLVASTVVSPVAGATSPTAAPAAAVAAAAILNAEQTTTHADDPLPDDLDEY